MAKVTERSLKVLCLTENNRTFKSWSFGLRVERHGAGFMVCALHRRPGLKQPKETYLTTEPLGAKEAKCFIDGFVKAAGLANGGEAKNPACNDNKGGDDV